MIDIYKLKKKINQILLLRGKGIKYQPFLLDIIIRIKSLPTTRFFTRVFLDYSEDPRSELSRTYVWKSEFRPSKILAPFQISETFSFEYEHKDEAKLLTYMYLK